MQSATPEAPTTPSSSLRSGHRRGWLVVALGVLVLAAAALGFVVARGTDSSTSASTSSRQLSSIQQACNQWRDTYSGSATPPSSWCDDMTAWMGNQATSGRMMGSMMWGTPDEMRAACQQWMSGSSVAGSSQNAAGWCDQMVAWMTGNGTSTGWGNGWMHGSMMGR